MAYTEFYVQPTGSNLNAGSTTDNAAILTYAAGTFVRATGVFTVASGNPQTDGVAVGMFVGLYTTAGATQVGLVARVTARNATTITVNTTDIAGATANVSEAAGASTLKVGGAWAGPSGAVGFPFNFAVGTLVNATPDPTRVNFLAGTYEITAAINHTLNGVIFQGYTATPGDGGLFKLGGDSASPAAPYTMLTISGAGNRVLHMWCDDNGGTTGGQTVGNNAMFDITGNGNHAQYCRFTNAYRVGARCGGAGSMISDCEAYSNNRDDASGFGGIHVTASGQVSRSISYNNLVGTDSCGFSASANDDRVMGFEDCISFNNAGNGFEFTGSDCSIRMKGCLSIDNDENGIEFNASTLTTSLMILEECIIYGSGLVGIRNASALRTGPNVINCAFGSNAGGVSTNVPASFFINQINLGADPFTDKANGDFTLNAVANGGELLRAAAVRAFFINTANLTEGNLTIDTRNVGAVQEEGGGGGSCGIETISGVPIASINEVA